MNVLCLDIVYFMAKEKQDFLLFCCIQMGKVSFRLGNKTELIGQPIAISPLHDQDKDKKNGDIKTALSWDLCG